MGSRTTRKSALLCSTFVAAATVSGNRFAEELRLINWGGYAPDDVVAQFEKETGIDVKVTLTNNEDMISKLRATGDKLQLRTVPATEWKEVENAAIKFWDEIAEESETKAKVVQIFKDYNKVINTAGFPYNND